MYSTLIYLIQLISFQVLFNPFSPTELQENDFSSLKIKPNHIKTSKEKKEESFKSEFVFL